MKRKIIRLFLIIGLIISVFTVLIYAVNIYPAMGLNNSDKTVLWFAWIITSILQIITITLGLGWFAYIFTKWNIKIIPSAFAGFLTGGILGFLSGGLTWGIMFVISLPNNLITVNDNFGWGSDNCFQIFSFVFIAAGTFGSMFGAPPGFFLAPIIRFIIVKGEKNEAAK